MCPPYNVLHSVDVRYLNEKLNAAKNVSKVRQSKNANIVLTISFTLSILPFLEMIKYLQFILLMLFLSHVCCWVDQDLELKILNSGSSQELRNSGQSTSKFGS